MQALGLLDERLQGFTGNAESLGSLSGERRSRDSGHEMVSRVLVRIELDLNELELRHRSLVGELGGELQEVRRDERLRPKLRQQRNHELEDLFTFGRIRAGAQLVEYDERTDRQSLE